MTDSPTEVAPDPPDSPERITRFQALAFFPADYATVQDGKVYASGAYFSLLRFPAFPANLPSMALVAVLQTPFHTHQHDHVVHMGLLDPDEKPMTLNIEGVFRTAPSIESKYGEPGVVPLAVPLYGLQFPVPGNYTFILKVDRTLLASYSINAVQVATIPVPQGPSSTPSE